MFKMFKKYRLNSLNERYARLVEQAREVRRRGDQQLYTEKMEEAEIVSLVIDRIRKY